MIEFGADLQGPGPGGAGSGRVFELRAPATLEPIMLDQSPDATTSSVPLQA